MLWDAPSLWISISSLKICLLRAPKGKLYFFLYEIVFIVVDRWLFGLNVSAASLRFFLFIVSFLFCTCSVSITGITWSSQLTWSIATTTSTIFDLNFKVSRAMTMRERIFDSSTHQHYSHTMRKKKLKILKFKTFCRRASSFPDEVCTRQSVHLLESQTFLKKQTPTAWMMKKTLKINLSRLMVICLDNWMSLVRVSFIKLPACVLLKRKIEIGQQSNKAKQKSHWKIRHTHGNVVPLSSLLCAVTAIISCPSCAPHFFGPIDTGSIAVKKTPKNCWDESLSHNIVWWWSKAQKNIRLDSPASLSLLIQFIQILWLI